MRGTRAEEPEAARARTRLEQQAGTGVALEGVFPGESAMAARCRAFDWASTPLGPVAEWGPALRTAVRLVLASPAGMSLWCGPAYTLVYNDAHVDVLGAKHPGALGRSGADVWAEIWPEIAPLMDQVRAGGPPVAAEHAPFAVTRQGRGVEDAWFDYALSGVRDDDGTVVAVLSVARDTTARVLAERARTAGILESMADAYFALDADLRLVGANAAMARNTGIPREQLLGRDVREAFPGTRGNVFEAHYRRAVDERIEAHFTHDYSDGRLELVTEVDVYPGPDGGAAVFWRDVTQRVRTEAALAASEARFRTVQDASPTGFAIHRPIRADGRADGAVVDFATPYVNAAGAAILGRSRKAVTAGTLLSIWPATATAGLFADHVRVLETGIPGHRELPYEHDGVSAGLAITTVRIGAGADAELGITFADVTARLRTDVERRALLAALEAERATLRSIILQTPAPLALLVGPEHRFELVNPAYRRISGGGRDVTGLTPPEAFPELAGSGIYELFDRVYETGEPWDGPETLVRYDRDGTGVQDTWFNLRFEPVRDGAGRVYAILNFAVDVTEQVRARHAIEELLAGSERARRDAEATRAEAEAAAARLERLQAATATLAASTSFEELARALRDTAASVLGASAALIYRLGDARFGEDPEMLYAALIEDAGGFGVDVPGRWPVVPLGEDAAVAKTVRTGAPILQATRAERARRYPHLMAQTMTRPFESWAMLPLLVEGRAVGSLALAWDAPQPGGTFADADRALATVLAAQCAVSLERGRLYAAERAARERAEAARVDAERANRAKSEFLATMSHELRTPLNAIGGYAELMELGIHGPVTEPQHTALARIQQSQRHLLGLIAGVLDYSRVEAGVVTYRLVDVLVTEAVAEAEVLVAPQLRAKGLGYGWSGAAPGLAVRADREKLQQILLNLLGNAIKFTHARDGVPGRIEVTCAAEPGGGRVAIHVRDTGEGIAPEQLERVFEPFVQADQRLTRPHAGVGLGLAISRDLARGMGGELTAESTPGQGSTFTLTLPRG